MTTTALTLAARAPIASAQPVRDLIEALGDAFPGRGEVLRALALGLVCPVPCNVLLLGPPGTAKTTTTRTLAEGLGGTFGAVTLSAWTDDAALLGGVDLVALQGGDVRRVARPGLLTTSDTYLLDELPRAGRGVRDLALSALAERLTPDGTPVPAHLIVATANTRLVDEDDKALADRFALRVNVARVGGADLRRVLARSVPVDGVRQARRSVATSSIPVSLLDDLRNAAAGVDVPGAVLDAVATLAETLRMPAPQGQRHPDVSERRWGVAMRLLQASAVLDDRTVVTFDDVLHVLPMVLDDGEDSRPAIAAAIASSIPAWVSAVDDVRKACDAALALARLIEVDQAPVSAAQAQAHQAREATLDALVESVRQYGTDATHTANALVGAALDQIDGLVEARLLAAKAARRR